MEYRSLGSMVIAFSFIFAAIILAGCLKYELPYLWMLAAVIVVVGAMVTKDLVDDYWFRSHPPRLDNGLIKALQHEYPSLRTLEAEKLEKFNQRLALFLLRKDGYLVTGETEDLDLYHQAWISAPAILYGFYLPFDAYEHIQKIVAYKHPFPSPRMQFIHSAELDMEDGVAIASIEQLSMGTRNPDKFYPISFHIWASHFHQYHKEFSLPDCSVRFKEQVGNIFPYEPDHITKILGYNSYRNIELALVAYAVYPQSFIEYDPETFKALNGILKWYGVNQYGRSEV